MNAMPSAEIAPPERAPLAVLQVAPAYAQIEVTTPYEGGAYEWPEWDYGDEAVVATSHALLVATQGDQDGDVTIVVADTADLVAGELVFDGPLEASAAMLEVGSSISGDLWTVRLQSAGPTRVRVYAAPAAGIQASAITLEFAPGAVRAIERVHGNAVALPGSA